MYSMPRGKLLLRKCMQPPVLVPMHNPVLTLQEVLKTMEEPGQEMVVMYRM